MFRRLFSESKSKDRRPRDVDALQTINELQQTEDMMNKKLEKFDEEINDIQNKARQCLTKSIPDRLVTSSLNIGQQHLKRAQKSMPTKKIEEILDNLGEQIEMSNDISDLLSTSIPTTDLLINDNEIENELNNEIINLPNAHSGSIKIPKSSINKQLEELQRLTTG